MLSMLSVTEFDITHSAGDDFLWTHVVFTDSKKKRKTRLISYCVLAVISDFSFFSFSFFLFLF